LHVKLATSSIVSRKYNKLISEAVFMGW